MNNNNKQLKRKMDKIYERKSKCPKPSITSNQRNEITELLSIIHNRQSGKNQKVSQLQMLPGGGVTDSHKMPVGV